MNLEFKRQVFHAIFGLVCVILIYFDYIGLNFFLFLLLTGLVISFIYIKREIRIVKWFLDRFDRKGRIPGKGVITFLVGIILCLLLFEKNIALASLMILSLGDSAVHLGKFGRIKHPFNDNKFIEGLLVGIFAGFVGAVFFVSVASAFFGAMIAMVFESFEINILRIRLDDNIIIPLIAGVVMSL